MIIFRYLAKEICAGLLATTLILLLIFLSNQFIHYMDFAVRGYVTAKIVILLLSLKLPGLLALVLPLSLFLSILLGYGRLHADNEMTIMFASGVSRVKLYWITSFLAFGVAIVIAVLMFWLGPQLNRYADRLIAKGAFSPLELIQPANFQKFNDWVLYVRKITHGHSEFHDIFAAHQPLSKGIISAEFADRSVDKKTGNTFLVLHNGNQYLGNPVDASYQLVHFKDYGIVVNAQKIADYDDAKAMATTKLWDNYANKDAAADLQWRASVPLMAFILALIAVPLSKAKTKQERYIQLVPAILLYVVYGNFMFLARSWLQDGKIAIWLGMWWVHLLMLFIAFVLIGYQFRWYRMLCK